MKLGASVFVAVLAAGASRRLGHPKQLVRWGDRPLLRRVVDEARASRGDRVAVVLGARADAVIGAIADMDRGAVDVLRNPHWTEGIASSIRCGVEWAEQGGASAVLLALADQPRLSAAHLDRLLDAYEGGATLAASRYEGALGVPALFARPHFSALLALRGDEGARRLIRGVSVVSAVDWPAGAFDIDLATDVRALTASAPPSREDDDTSRDRRSS